MRTNRTLLDDSLPLYNLSESESGMTCHHLQIISAHSLEEGELEQFLVYLKTTHHDYMYV